MKTVLCVMLLCCSSVLAAELLDQKQEQNDNQWTFGRVGGGTWGAVGQTFTTDVADANAPVGPEVENVSKIQLMIMDSAGSSHDGVGVGVTVNLWNSPDRTQLLGQAYAPDNSIPGVGGNEWVDFVFDAPVPVYSGVQYYIEVTHNDGRGSYSIAAGDGNYDSGTILKVDGEIPNITGVTDCDTVFKTYDGSLNLDVEGGTTASHLHWFDTQAFVGQTFRPVANTLGRIDLWLVDDLDKGVDPVTLHLYRDVDRIEYLASATVDSLATGWAYASFVFDSPVTVTPGQTYFFEVTSVNSEGSYGLGWDGGSTYTDGHYWKSDVTLSTVSGWDLTFRTYHKPYSALTADIYEDGIVDMKDFGIFAEQWLETE